MFPAGESKPCARCAGFSTVKIGNRRKHLCDHTSFPDLGQRPNRFSHNKNGGIKMGYQIYCGKGFDTQKAERFFKERRVPYQRVDVLKYGIGKRELESVAAAVGLDALCDKDSKAFRESVIAYTQNRDTILNGLMEKPQLLKLPIVRDGRRATVGFCPEVWEEWIKG